MKLKLVTQLLLAVFGSQPEDPRVTSILAAQISNDARVPAWVPDWHQPPSEWLSEVVPELGELRISYAHIGSDIYHTWFRMEHRSDNLKLIYATDCQKKFTGISETGIHRLFWEYYFTKKAYELGIGPKVHYISTQVPLPAYGHPEDGHSNFKVWFELVRFRTIWNDCVATRTGDVRFMVIEELSRLWILRMQSKPQIAVLPGNTQPVTLKYTVPFDKVLRLGMTALELLKVWHLAGFVHGNVGGTSFALRNPTDLSSMELVDLRNAGFGGSNKFVEMKGSGLEQQHASLWEARGEPPSMRSDVFRVLRWMAEMALSFLDPRRKFDAEIVASGSLFSLYGSIDPVLRVPHLTDSDRAALRAALIDMTTEARNLKFDLDPSKDDTPYERILSHMRTGLRIIEDAASLAA